jgi:AcrR family transcriptional regulator
LVIPPLIERGCRADRNIWKCDEQHFAARRRRTGICSWTLEVHPVNATTCRVSSNWIVNQVSTLRAVARRPGGRTAEISAKIHKAVDELLIEGGVAACTFNAVADRAGIQRSTLYRRYSDRWDMMIDAMMARAAADVMPDRGLSFADDLTSVLRKLVDVLESPVGPTLMMVAAELRAHSRGDFSRVFFHRRMAQLDPMFDAAVARGELRPDIDRETLFTLAAGPIYFRMFIAARAVDDEFIHSIVASVCWLYCSPSVAAKLSLPARIA